MNKTKIILRAFAFILFVVTASSCTQTEFLTLRDSDSQDVKLYFTKMPDRHYDELEYIVTDGISLNEEKQQFLQEAKKAGADAVVNTQVYYNHNEYVISGMAVKLRND